MNQKDRSAGAQLARKLKLDPHRIVEAFLGALEDANQHDFYRVVEAEWARLIQPGAQKQRTISINDNDASCPKCGLERANYTGLFHHPDGGDEEARVTCKSCGEKFTILRKVIVAEYSVKEKS